MSPGKYDEFAYSSSDKVELSPNETAALICKSETPLHKNISIEYEIIPSTRFLETQVRKTRLITRTRNVTLAEKIFGIYDT